jgi:hypothetical protein
MRLVYSIFLFVVFGLAWPVAAHHSDSGYDRGTVVAFEGQVVRYNFRNPHVAITVARETESGQREKWELETGSTPLMIRSGWSAELMSPGDTVIVRAHPERSGRHRAILNTLETADGKLWMQVETDPETTAAATSLDGVWRGHSDFRFRASVGQMLLTPAAETARAQFDYFRDSPVADCVAPQPPNLIGTVTYLNGIEVLDDRVVLRNEYFDQTRIVYMDGRGHPQDGEAERTNEGHSIGLWEDDVLVVDTVQFADHPSGNGRGVPSGDQKHMTERYSLSEDGTRALVDIVVEDPEFLAEPYSGHTEMVYSPHLQLLRYDCLPELSRQGGFE